MLVVRQTIDRFRGVLVVVQPDDNSRAFLVIATFAQDEPGIAALGYCIGALQVRHFASIALSQPFRVKGAVFAGGKRRYAHEIKPEGVGLVFDALGQPITRHGWQYSAGDGTCQTGAVEVSYVVLDFPGLCYNGIGAGRVLVNRQGDSHLFDPLPPDGSERCAKTQRLMKHSKLPG